MGRQHLAVGIHVDAGSFGLLQQLFQIGKIVTRYQDGRILAYTEIHFRDLRMAILCCVGFIQQRHRCYAELPRFQGQGHQFIGGESVVQCGCQRFVNKGVNLAVFLADIQGVVRIGRHSFQAIGD